MVKRLPALYLYSRLLVEVKINERCNFYEKFSLLTLYSNFGKDLHLNIDILIQVHTGNFYTHT